MDFRFDEEERDIVQQAGRTLSRALPRDALLEGDRSSGWRAVGHDGWLTAGLAEERGGAGLSLSLLAAVGREAGRVLAGNGFVNNGVLLPELLAQADGAAELLEAATERPGFLLADGRGERLVAGPRATATPWCFGAERGMAAYRLSDDGLLERYGPDAWTLAPVAGLALDVGTVTLRPDAEPELAVQVGEQSGALLARALVVHAAALVGLGEVALTDTVDYVKERHQFGGPIGRFQAVKHGLADVSVALEIAWNAVLYASLVPQPVPVSTAHLQATEAADAAIRAMTQFFGGIAMTWEHHAHLYTKAALAGIWRFGSAAEHARRIGRDLVEGRTA
jgi:alkylation response protein AidB-like acyl-CoA dehydrogenase